MNNNPLLSPEDGELRLTAEEAEDEMGRDLSLDKDGDGKVSFHELSQADKKFADPRNDEGLNDAQERVREIVQKYQRQGETWAGWTKLDKLLFKRKDGKYRLVVPELEEEQPFVDWQATPVEEPTRSLIVEITVPDVQRRLQSQVDAVVHKYSKDDYTFIEFTPDGVIVFREPAGILNQHTIYAEQELIKRYLGFKMPPKVEGYSDEEQRELSRRIKEIMKKYERKGEYWDGWTDVGQIIFMNKDGNHRLVTPEDEERGIIMTWGMPKIREEDIANIVERTDYSEQKNKNPENNLSLEKALDAIVDEHKGEDEFVAIRSDAQLEYRRKDGSTRLISPEGNDEEVVRRCLELGIGYHSEQSKKNLETQDNKFISNVEQALYEAEELRDSLKEEDPALYELMDESINELRELEGMYKKTTLADSIRSVVERNILSIILTLTFQQALKHILLSLNISPELAINLYVYGAVFQAIFSGTYTYLSNGAFEARIEDKLDEKLIEVKNRTKRLSKGDQK